MGRAAERMFRVFHEGASILVRIGMLMLVKQGQDGT